MNEECPKTMSGNHHFIENFDSTYYPVCQYCGIVDEREEPSEEKLREFEDYGKYLEARKYLGAHGFGYPGNNKNK